MIELTDTTSAEISEQFVVSRRRAGSPAMGMVMTLVVVVDEEHADSAMEAARKASHEHPARVLGVVVGNGRGGARVDAQIGTGEAGWAGETAVIRLSGEVVTHAESVVLPLLLPDSPVVTWWPGRHPADPAADPVGALASRRITDSAHTGQPTTALRKVCAAYAPGNTDLAWTRITGWRALLAAALDQTHATVTAGSVTAERTNPSADLMVAWLESRLGVEVHRGRSAGPGITEIVLETSAGPVRIARADGRHGVFSSPGKPDRPVALKRREFPELLAEELRRLDEDDIFAAVSRRVADSTETKEGSR